MVIEELFEDPELAELEYNDVFTARYYIEGAGLHISVFSRTTTS